ncbi:potassium channel family protein [candidate division KSB1 bacterium]
MSRFKEIPTLYKRLLFILFLVVLIYFIGTTGYLLLEDNYSLVDALYMTTITLATVGFQEVYPLHTDSRIFTIFVILIGITILGYAGSTVTSLIVEGQLRHTFRDRKMYKDIKKLKSHIILCGHGRLGSHAARELKHWNQDFVVIEQDEQTADSLKSENIKCIQGSAIDDEVLIEAGVENAKGLIAALAEDTENLFVTLSARRLNKDLIIITRVNYEINEKKLISAGADKVILPTQLAGRRMASMLVQPQVASFLDVVVETGDKGLSLQEIEIPTDSRLDGVLIRNANMPHNIRIIGLHTFEEMLVNPRADQKLKAGYKMIVLGENATVEDYKRQIIT